MVENIINFSYNWNEKLNCNAFTTVRLENHKKYNVGSIYEIHLKNQLVKKCLIQDIKILKQSQFNQFIAYLDTGYSLGEFHKVIERMYPHIKKNPNQKFMLILLVTIKH